MVVFVVAAAYAAKIGGVSIVKIRQHRQNLHHLEIKEAKDKLQNGEEIVATSSTITTNGNSNSGVETSTSASAISNSSALSRIRASITARNQARAADDTQRGDLPRKRSFRWRRATRQRSLREETTVGLFADPLHPTEMDNSQAEDIQWMWLEESRVLEQQQREQVQQFRPKQTQKELDTDETNSTASNESTSSSDATDKKESTSKDSFQDESERFFDCHD